MRLFIVLLFAALIIPEIVVSQDVAKSPKKQYKAVKLTQQAPLIDGKLDEPMWQELAKGGDFVQFQPYENKQPSQKTDSRAR